MPQSLRILLDADTLAARVKAMGARISEDYRDRELVVVCVLSGSFVFASDLVRAIELPLSVDFLAVRSYGDASVSSGVVRISNDLTWSVEGKDVLVVEDIVDTGLTVKFLLENLRTRAPRSLKLAALLHKPARTRVEVPIDYLGFEIEDHFVVGYGLDHAQRYRNLPHLAVLDPSEDENP